MCRCEGTEGKKIEIVEMELRNVVDFFFFWDFLKGTEIVFVWCARFGVLFEEKENEKGTNLAVQKS